MSEPLAPDSTVVIVGASLAGMRAAEEVRHLGHPGPVIVIGDEVHPPYDRPPLSKQFLAGKWDVERIHHHTPDKLDSFGLRLKLGHHATSLRPDERVVVCSDGEEIRYDGLVVATGARPRSLPGTEGMAHVHVLRTLDDCMSIRSDLQAAGGGARVVVVGAGFIGSEVAATCHGMGATVTMVEALPTPLGRVLGERMGEACGQLHRRHGVTLRTGVGVERVVPGSEGGAAVVLELDDGSRLDADLVVVGIGVAPVTDWLEGSGLELDDGVVCTESLFAAEGVVAVGDASRWTHRGLGRSVRVEHWTNAAEGGTVGARNLISGSRAATPYDPIPFFWSDQYETKIQMLGLPDPDDEMVMVDGPDDDGRLVALYRRGDRLGAALAFSRPRQLMAYRPLLAAGASFDEALAVSRS